MTKVTFYSNLENKQALLLKLVQAAVQKKHQVMIMTENEKSAAEISQDIWQRDTTSFMPNAIASHDVAVDTPVVIEWQQEKELNQDDILINVTQQQPRLFSRFKTLIELVSKHEEDKAAARTRFKFYRDRGYEIKHIDYQQRVS